MIRWSHLVIERPRAELDRARAFWSTVTGARAEGSPGRPARIAGRGPTYLMVEGVDGPAGARLDLVVDDLPATLGRAVAAGAVVTAERPDRTLLRSPNGVHFGLLAAGPGSAAGPAAGPAPVAGPGGVLSRVDQICLDLPPLVHDAELAFWAGLTGWPAAPGALPEFTVVRPPAPHPVRILVQRLVEGRAASAHVDVACADVAAIRAWHESCGAETVRPLPAWTVLRDPAGGIYCLTGRSPITGNLGVSRRSGG